MCDRDRERGAEFRREKPGHDASTGAPARQIDARAMQRSRAGASQEETPFRFPVHALVNGIEDRRDAPYLIDHDPLVHRRDVERLMQTLWFGREGTRDRSRPQVQHDRVGETLHRDGRLPGASWPEEKGAPCGRRAEPSDGWSVGDQGRHLLTIDRAAA